MARFGRIRGPRARLAALALVLAAGVAAGFAFDRTELRGVTVAPTPRPTAEAHALPPGDTAVAAPAAQTAAAAPDPATPATPAAVPTGFAEAFEAGLRHFRAGDAHGAVKAFEAARLANPHAPEAHLNLGFAYLELDQPAAAQVAFDKATSIAPMQANAYYGLAEALDALGDTEGAMGAMRTFLHLADPDDPFRRRAMSALWEWESGPVSLPGAEAQSPAGSDAAASEPTPPSPAAESGVAVYDAPLQTLDGRPTSLAEHRGKFVVLNVWAVWCAPCRAELPSLDRLAAALDPQEFSVLGVSIDRERAFTAEYLSELGVGFTSYWDGERLLTGDMLGANKIPLTVILDREGQVLFGYEGARDWSAPGTVAAIRDLADTEMPFDKRVAAILKELR